MSDEPSGDTETNHTERDRSETSIRFEALFADAVNGDREAQNALFQAYEPIIRAAVRYVYGGAPESDQNDLIQEVYMSSFNSLELHEWTSRAGFQAWLRRIVTCRRNDELRKRSAQKRDADKEVHGVEWDRQNSDKTGIETGFDRREELVKLHKLMRELPHNYHQALVMHHLGHSHAEIADALEVSSAEAARKLVSRGHEKLLSLHNKA
jgi:RNA polymerase sigma factor (sigma-70 family)